MLFIPRIDMPAKVVSSYADFEELRAAFQIPAERLAQAIGVSSIVLRKRRLEGHFSSVESTRLARFSDLFHNSVYALGGKAAVWLTRPGPRFGGIAPLEFAMTKSGYQEMCNIVENVADDSFG